MVFTFRLVGTGKDPFFRDFEISGNQTFFDFHLAIQDELRYDKKQMASFYLADNKWEKGLEINLFDMSDESHTPVIIMEETRLCELISETRQRLLYLFDFFSNRAFYIELVEINHKDPGKTYPDCTARGGVPPAQIIIEDPDITDI
ncbi:MAG: hypothetical protein EA408_10010 [Marinilabiliales bacterium]|nr:MAG: hypothetical protein EA408_10010 [Marinilabiliales bacterium]